MAGEDVYCVMLGHLHHNKTDYVQGIKTMMAGSFVGTDNFTIEKRIIGQPQQLVCVATDIGVLCQYDVNFKSNV
jgi:predicted metal-dependent phosphotriesterase family hydrolase